MKLRNFELIKILNNIPKVELHCHLEGIFNIPMAKEASANFPNTNFNLNDFISSYPINTNNKFWNWWNITKPMFESWGPLIIISNNFIRDLINYHYRYIEIMVPTGNVKENLDENIEQLKTFLQGIKYLAGNYVQIEFLISISRHKPIYIIERSIDLAIKLFKSNIICGVAICGKEKGYPVKRFSKYLEKALVEGVKIEVHAGEWAGSEYIWDAIQYGGASRIGHGLTIFNDNKLLAYIIKNNIHIEICLSSNLCTEALQNIYDHPIKHIRNLELNYSINTDNPGIFNCSLVTEYLLAMNNYQLTVEDIRNSIINAERSAFVKIKQNSLNSHHN